MKELSVTTISANGTMELAKAIAKLLKVGDILCLHGDLGGGKTTFVQGLAKGLSVAKNKVHSPTFTLMNMYEGKLPLYHFDLYRLDNPREINAIGYDEFLYGNGVAVIEWADKLKELYPKECLSLSFEHRGENERRIVVNAFGKRYEKLLKRLGER